MTYYATIGDSIGYGATTSAVNVPIPTRVGIGLGVSSGNYAISGGRYVAGGAEITARWNAIKARPEITHLLMQGGVNDLILDTSAVDLFTAWEAICDEALGLDIEVIGCTVTPWKGHGSWTEGKQTETEAFNAAVLGKAGIIAVDLYDALGDTDPEELPVALRADVLHPNEAGNLIAANTILAAL